MPIKFRWPQDINAIRFGTTLVWGVVNGIITTIQGTSPLSLVNAVAGRIKSLVQYGKCTTVDDEIYCNNGKLVIVDDELPSGYKRLLGITFDGNFRYETGEALTGDDDVTMTLNNLSTSGKNVFGSYNGANSKNFSLYIYGSTSGSYFRFGDQLKRPKYGGTGQRTITFGKSGTSGFADDSDVTPDEFTTPANTYIGMLPNSSSAAFTGDIIGSITVSNRLEWIPCENPGGVIGYYEKYNRNFLEPVGSGSPVSLGYDTSHLTVLSIEGTPEVLTIGTQTATVENLLAVDDIKDEQNIISGTVTRRCEAVISDGTTPSGRYIGTVGEGNIIVKVRETGYEGDVATFEADSVAPLNGLTVNVEPIQDLHGYDSPWPDGGGKNKLNSGFCLNRTLRGLTTVVNADGSITLTGTAEAATRYWNSANTLGLTLAAGTYTLSPSNLRLERSGGSVSGTFTLSEETTFSNVYWAGFTSGEVVNTVVYPQLEAGSTATTFSPYSNICPISGRTSATVTRTGINIWDEQTEDGYITATGGLAPYANAIRSKNFTSCKPNEKYVHHHKQGMNGCTIAWYDESKTFIQRDSVDSSDNVVVTTPGNAYYFKLSFYNYKAQDASIYNNDVSINYPYTNNGYYAYSGNTYTIQIGDTVYGGTLDVTGGKMVVDRAMVDLGTLNWQYDSVANFKNFWAYGFTVIAPPPNNDEKANILCSNYKTITANKGYLGTELVGIAVAINKRLSVYDPNYQRLFVYDPNYSDASVFKTAMSGVQLCYELATPIEITLTPTQIEMLIGQNNIWSDAGSVKVYVADGNVTEHVTAQPMRTAEGSNTVSVTSAVDPVQLEIDYYKNE